jgi:hypothetical protein
LDADNWVWIARVEALAEMAEKLRGADARRCQDLLATAREDPEEEVRRTSRWWLERLEQRWGRPSYSYSYSYSYSTLFKDRVGVGVGVRVRVGGEEGCYLIPNRGST